MAGPSYLLLIEFEHSKGQMHVMFTWPSSSTLFLDEPGKITNKPGEEKP